MNCFGCGKEAMSNAGGGMVLIENGPCEEVDYTHTHDTHVHVIYAEIRENIFKIKPYKKRNQIFHFMNKLKK